MARDGIFRRSSDGRYCAVLRDGRGKKYLYGTTRAEVKAKRDDARAQAAAGGLVRREKLTVRAYLAEWRETKRLSVRDSTYWCYRARLGHIIAHLGDVRLSQLRRAEIETCYAALLDQGLAPGTIRLIHTIFSSALSAAVGEYLPKNPALGATLPRVPHREMLYLDEDQVRLLLRELASHRLVNLFTALILTGLRIGEALALRWEHVDRDAAMLHVRETAGYIQEKGRVASELKTAQSRRDIPLGPAVLAALAQQEQQNRLARIGSLTWQERGIVFPNTSGGYLALTVVGGALDRAARASGLPDIRVHDLRHTFATLHLASGTSLHELARLMGHASAAQILSTYGHAIPERAVAAQDRLERAVIGGPK